MRARRLQLARRGLLALGASIALVFTAGAEEARAPSPKHIIYPGDLIADDMLVEAPLAAPPNSGPVAMSASDIVGMAAARTLLPGQSIPMTAVRPPRVLRAGAPVKMVYVDGGLEITATGSALQDGSVGQTVKVRNDDSGVTVSGRVRGDGSILVDGG